MIFALRQPAILLGLLAGFLVGIPLRCLLGDLLTGAIGRRSPRGPRPIGRRSTGLRRGWSRYFDPFGAVAAVLAGIGWGAEPAPMRRRTGGPALRLLAALLAHGALAAGGFALAVAAGWPRHFLDIPVTSVLHGDLGLASTGQAVALGLAMVNLGCALLALVPIPPLELGVLLWGRLPRSPGARRLAYHLLEEHWGVAVVLVLLLLPLGGHEPPLLALVNTVGHDILSAI